MLRAYHPFEKGFRSKLTGQTMPCVPAESSVLMVVHFTRMNLFHQSGNMLIELVFRVNCTVGYGFFCFFIDALLSFSHAS